MRTPAEAGRPAVSRRADPAPAKEGRGRTRPKPSAVSPPMANGKVQPVAVTAVRMVAVDEGLYALRIGEIGGDAGAISGMEFPVAQVATPFAEDGNGPEIVASFPRRGPWLGREGGTVIIRSPAGGGHVIVTAYGPAEQSAVPLALDLRRLDGPVAGIEKAAAAAAATSGGSVSAESQTREVPTEILLHIERAGDRLFPGRGWVGALGRKLRIEAFSIRPLESLAAVDIELKGYLPGGNETQWVHGGILCGTRGRRMPLIGFAVRLAPRLADRFEVTYQGSFFASGISGVQRNGEPCRSTTGDDPLEAINIRIVESACPKR